MQILPQNNPLVAATSTNWQQQLKESIRDVETLLDALELTPPQPIGNPIDAPIPRSSSFADSSRQPHPSARVVPSQAAEAKFRTFVPRPFLDRIQKGNWHDPLLLQVLPVEQETIRQNDTQADPTGDIPAEIAPGVLQKYHGRALLIAAKSCAINCRYCFRREYPYESIPAGKPDWTESLEYIAEDFTIREVIVSGGDPLMNVDATLAWLIRELETIPHVQRLRIHTRLPIVIPERVTPALVTLLSETRLKPTVVLHSNHPQELDESVARAAARLRSVPGLILLNQSVLLRGVNDSSELLAALSWRLLDLGIIPYYLHQLDRVHGASHFEVPISRGREIARELEALLPGYAVPQYVQEIPGSPGKTRLT